jgi:hypothetical protein
VAVGIQARRAEDLDTFVEALENGGTFHNVLAVTEQTGDEGLIEAVVEGAYVPPPREAAPASPEPASAPYTPASQKPGETAGD